MFNHSIQSVAHPTMGIVLLGGLSDPVKRLPFHNSAGICYSLVGKDSVSRTTLTISDEKMESTLNGKPIDQDDSRSPFKLINTYHGQITRKFGERGIYFNSVNENIISGSSDAGAAALGRCVFSILPDINLNELELNMRMVSESAGRSYYGGLTITEGIDKPFTRQILNEEYFKNFRILSAVFPHERKPSDDIHFNQPKSLYYKKRIENANRNVETLKVLSSNKDISGIFDLAMNDTDDYHYVNGLVNVHIVTEAMKNLMDEIREIRKRFWISYIVTGGNSVFLITAKTDTEKAKELALNHTKELYELEVSGKSRVVHTTFNE
ncbi:MAG: mevalonate-3-kinase [Cuniculiplasma sp.]